jgi:WD40 repeat protein
MRPLCVTLVTVCLALTSFAAAPPARLPAEVTKWIDQLGDDDTRKAAEKKLTQLGEAILGTLRRVGNTHADADVRLRAMLLASAIEKKVYGEVRTYMGHTDGPIAFALSPDGKRMVSGSWGDLSEHVARVWDVRTGKEQFKLEGHESGVVCMAWSSDGKRILTGSYDKTIRLWDARGKHLKTLSGHAERVHAVLFTPDGKKAVSCADERVVFVWDLKSGKTEKRIAAHAAGVRGLAWLPGGKQVVSAGYDGAVCIVDIEAGKLVKAMDGSHAGGAWFVAVSPDGKRVASCGADKMVRLWDVATGKQIKEFSGHTEGVHGIAYSRDGKRLLSCAEAARLWDIGSGKEIQVMGEDLQARVVCVAFLSEDHAMFCASDKILRLWKLRK